MRIFLFLAITSLMNVITVQTTYAQSPSITKVTKKSYNGSDVSCYGISDAQLTVVPAAGQAQLTYSMNGAAYQSSSVFSNLGAGHYYFTAKNAQGVVSNRLDIDVSTPNPLRITSLFNTGGTWGGNVSCYGSSDGSFGFTTDGGTGIVLSTIGNGNNYKSSFYFDNLSVGTYTVKIKDANGCTASGDYTVKGPDPITASFNQTDYTCSTSKGTVIATPAGGSPGYTFNVDQGSTSSNTTFSNLSYGSHSVKIVDNHNCTATINFNVNVINPPAPTISYAATPFCSNLSSAYPVTQTGTTGGTYSSSPAGLSLTSGNGNIVPASSTPGTYTVTYTVAATGKCQAQTAKTSVTITAIPNATISYNGTPYCSSAGTASVSLTGTTGGTFSSDAALSINASTGVINLSASTAGTHKVTYTITANGGCSAFSTSTNLTITTQPFAEGFFPANPYCSNIGTLYPSGTKVGIDGVVSATPSGLSIDSHYAIVDVNNSKPGHYTVMYNVPAYGGCKAYFASAPLIISSAPTATISYNSSAYCKSVTASQSVNITATDPGTFSASPAGLNINATSGAIIPSSSTPGTYTVSYSMAARDGCSIQTGKTTVTITAIPNATISYNGTPYCSSAGTASASLTGTTGGTFSSDAGLSINASTGAVNLSASTAGTHTVTYAITANGGCAAFSTTTNITITTQPFAQGLFPATPYCSNIGTLNPAGSKGGLTGTFSATPSGLSINAGTGIINMNASVSGSYTVLYSVPAYGGCAAYTASSPLTISSVPSAVINYSSSSFCQSLNTAQSISMTGTQGGTYSASPSGLTFNSSTGAITPSTSKTGTYTVTYTMAANGGCTAQTATTTVTITALSSAKISYPSSLYCTNAAGNQGVVINGTGGGTFSSSPAGLSINSANGDVTPSGSNAGSYTITYTMAATGGCSTQTATTTMTIVGAPAASISYSKAPFCNSLDAAQSVTITGTQGGTFSAPSDLNINQTTGAITPSAGKPGNYTVTYTVSKVGLVSCPATTATTAVVISAVPNASISYAGSPFCNTSQVPASVTLNGTSGGTFSAANLTINASTGAITPKGNSVGNYTINYTIPAAGGCASFSTFTAVSIGAPGTWTGKADNNWNNISNWICGIPNTTIDAYIPNTVSVFPVVTSTSASAKNITIDAGASLTVTGSLQIAGNISNKGTFDATAGTLEFVYGVPGATLPPAQIISGSWFVNKTINNLKLSNSKGLTLYSTLNDTLNVTGLLSFGESNVTFNTNNNLTLKSTVNGTANVADITNNGVYKGNTITGNVTVERYINMGTQPGQHNKAWVMVSTPAQGETIYQSWMENGDKTIKGYGTQITGSGVGFDAYSAGPALKYYNDANNTWTAVTNANTSVYNPLGYILFVRGDRTTAYPNISNTTLRTTGTLLCGSSTPVAVKAGKFQSVGNPYASAVDIRKISATNINADIIVWDPTLTTGNAYGVGAYQTLYKDGDNYRNLLTSDAYGNSGTVNNNIESGVAFFVQSFNKDGQIYFTESAKATDCNKGIAMRAQGDSDNGIALKTTLYVMNADSTSFVTDGTMEQFSTDYSNAIDGMDTRKLTNTSENLSIRDQGKDLVIDRRSYLTASDTIYYNLTGVTNRNYRLIFNGSNLSTMGVTGFIEDSYTNTKTPLNADGDTQLDFTVSSAAGSKVANRFYIVFKTLNVMPVTFTSIKATAAKTTISVDWNVENQKNLKEYDVERSADGTNFSQAGVVATTNTSTAAYNWIDENPFSGNNYYRVKSVDLDGKVAYTSIVKAQIGGIVTSMEVYPNPAVNANVNIRFGNQPAGVYYARLVNQLGQVIVSKKIVVSAGTSTENIEWNKDVAKGIYNLQITMPDGETKVVKIAY